jgi:hypothetical protein
VLVGVHEFVAGSYRPPVLEYADETSPPHTIIVVPVQTASWLKRGNGTPAPMLVVRHVSVVGS